MIKIITGYSGPGGSTVALKNLCLEFNKRGIECEMYGHNNWFLQFGNSCKPMSQLSIKQDDKLISHFIGLKNCKKENVIFSCHEMWWFNFSSVTNYFNKVQFLTQKQADYHKSIKDYVLIPNVKEEITISRTEEAENVAGIIGNIDERKDLVSSIERALADGCRKVLIYGQIFNMQYFTNQITPFFGKGVVYMGYEKSKEKIYSSIDRVYHMSKGEVASLVKDECYTTNTLFFGNESTDNVVSTMSNDEVIAKWLKEFNYEN